MSETAHGHDAALMNAGWVDDPNWRAICDCDWETWDHPTEESARERHSEHVADIVLTGHCQCPTCVPPDRKGSQ